jgi:hypothetical protein
VNGIVAWLKPPGTCSAKNNGWRPKTPDMPYSRCPLLSAALAGFLAGRRGEGEEVFIFAQLCLWCAFDVPLMCLWYASAMPLAHPNRGEATAGMLTGLLSRIPFEGVVKGVNHGICTEYVGNILGRDAHR